MRLVALAFAMVMLASCVSASDVVPGSFYLEATITVIDDRQGVTEPEVTTRLRWWSESTDRWRWEIDQSGAGEFSADGSVSVSDGDTVWFYDPRSNSYQRTEPFELPDSFVATPFPASVPFGPANALTLDDIAGEFKLRDPEIEVVVSGLEEVLGVQAALLDYRPTWRSTSATATLDSSGSQNNVPGEDESGGVGRMWVDLDTMFILRHEIDGGSNMQYVLIEVTRVDHGVEFDDGRFEFVPPDGAIEEQPGGGSSSTGSTSAP